MKVYVVEEYLNSYPDGGYQGIAAVFDSKEKAEKYCKSSYLFENFEVPEGGTYYGWYEYEVE